MFLLPLPKIQTDAALTVLLYDGFNHLDCILKMLE